MALSKNQREKIAKFAMAFDGSEFQRFMRLLADLSGDPLAIREIAAAVFLDDVLNNLTQMQKKSLMKALGVSQLSAKRFEKKWAAEKARAWVRERVSDDSADNRILHLRGALTRYTRVRASSANRSGR